MDSISAPATFSIVLTRLVVATALGAAIGLNRELQRKPAGLRTHALVALGAAMVVQISLGLAAPGGVGDPSAVSRVIQGLLAGVGFIGGGVILHRDDRKGVHGLTTAAAIWVVAAVGVASGVGMWRSAVAAAALTLLVLTAGEFVDRALHPTPPGGE